jgi:hypothetical protein
LVLVLVLWGGTLAILFLRGERKSAAGVSARVSDCAGEGPDHGCAKIWPLCRRRIYPDYELIVVAHSARDIPPGVLLAVHVVLAPGDDLSSSAKVRNLRR